MKWFVPLFAYGAYLATFSRDLRSISAGLFVMGFFHQKSNLCYTHGVELVEDKYNNVVQTALNAFDCTLFIQMGFFYKYFSKDAELLLQISFWVGALSSVLYLLFIPESPKWLFMKKGSNCQEGIAVLNYIAWFNGSKYVVPKEAHFDAVGQIMQENLTLDNTTAGRLRL